MVDEDRGDDRHRMELSIRSIRKFGAGIENISSIIIINTSPTDSDPSGADASYRFRHVVPGRPFF